jgi:hypothetical protein
MVAGLAAADREGRLGRPRRAKDLLDNGLYEAKLRVGDGTAVARLDDDRSFSLACSWQKKGMV